MCIVSPNTLLRAPIPATTRLTRASSYVLRAVIWPHVQFFAGVRLVNLVKTCRPNSLNVPK